MTDDDAQCAFMTLPPYSRTIVSQAKGFGVDARSVANPHKLRQVLQESLAANGPMVVEVPITKAVPPLL